MKELNRHRYENAVRVLEALWRKRALSRADLARHLRLDRSTTGSLIDFFLERRLVTERPVDPGEAYSRLGGRPPFLVGLKAATAFSVGVELRPGEANVISTDLFGNVLCEQRCAVDLHSGGAGEALADTIQTVARRTTNDVAEASTVGLVAIGIGVSGIVSPDALAIEFSRELRIHTTFDLGRQLGTLLGVPAWLFTDADSCALAELEYGDNRPDDLLFVLAKYAPPVFRAGLGIVLDGNLRSAHSGVGREFRSPFVQSRSPEQFAVGDEYRNGELSVSEALERFSEELAVSIAFLVHALDLRNVVLGGDIEPGAFDLVAERIGRHVQIDTVRADRQPLELRASTNSTRAVAHGSTAGALRKLFETRRFPIPGTAVRETVRPA